MAENRKTAKFALVFIFILIGFFIVVVKTFSVQIIHGTEYKERAKRQHESTKPIKARRGNIIDKNGNLLVTSTELYTVAVDPYLLKDTMMLCKILAARTDSTADFFYKKIKDCKTHYVVLARGIKESQVTAIKALDDRGVLEISKPKRKYIHGKAASQVIGLTDLDANGVGGLELRYNEELQGTDGILFCQRDAVGNLYLSPSMQEIPAHDGNTLMLTIDVDLQKIMEYELANGVNQFQANSATAIAVNPKTGEVLAMATYPDYDPNNRISATYNHIRNRAITDQYEPGSTFKMVTAAAAFEEGIISEDDTVDGQGGILKIYRNTIRDTHPYGKMTFTEAVEVSSNVVFAKLANKISEAGGVSKFYKYIRDFGFGLETGIDLYGEISGHLPKPKEFSGVTTSYIGHGYGLNVTPIQLTMAYAAVANDGILMRPHLVKEIRTSKNKLIHKYEPEMIRRVISEENARRLRNMFVGVVEKGTGTEAKIIGLNIAGKTGTSKQLDSTGQYRGYNYNASFIGMYPAKNPEIVMLVLVDRPRTSFYGGTVAGPIFKNITARWVGTNHTLAQDKYVLDSVLTLQEKKVPYFLNPSVIGMTTQNAEKYLEDIDYSLKYDEEGVISSQTPKENTIRTGKSKKIEVLTFSHEIGLEKQKQSRNKPNVKGLPLRQAVAMLHNAGFITKVKGSGCVINQTWTTNVHNEEECTLRCD